MKLLPLFEALLAGWKAMAMSWSHARTVRHAQAAEPARHEVIMGEIPGRSGTLALQGKEFLA